MSEDIAGLVELTSLADGYRTLDAMVKMAPVTVLKAEIINPGRFLIIVSGDLASVESVMDAALAAAGTNCHDHALLRNLHDSVLPSLEQPRKPEKWDALGLLETTSIVAAVEAADHAVKIADVEIVEITAGQEAGGKGLLRLNGLVGDINYAMKTIAARAEEKGRLLRKVIIPNPHNDIKGFVSGNQ